MRCRRAILLVSLAVSLAGASSASYLDIRTKQVALQWDWFTCGPAAVSTLFTHYYRWPVGERQVLDLSLRAMGSAGRNARQRGITALALKQAMGRFGVRSEGYELTLNELRDYFREGGLPVILHVTKPEAHYVVGVGMVGDQVVLADPSWGRRILPLNALKSEKGFSGVTLVPLPDSKKADNAARAQAENLAWARQRLNRLGKF